jgi:predicted HAD superfamily Cof-like phosphohydrolase
MEQLTLQPGDEVKTVTLDSTQLSNYEKVKQFTEESTGKSCPKTPQLMSKSSVDFIIGMVMSELAELAQTVYNTPDEVKMLLHNSVGIDLKTDYEKPEDPVELIGQQADSMLDSWYYMLNCACKHGMDLSALFEVVHTANMAKKWDDGTFHRREDGKVIKPPDWKEPNIKDEILRQCGFPHIAQP